MEPLEPEEYHHSTGLEGDDQNSDGTSPDTPFPWPPSPGDSILSALIRTWKLATFEPSRFFQALPTTGQSGPAVLYFLLIGISAAGITLFWQSISSLAISVPEGFDTTWIEAEWMGWMPLIYFLLSPLILLVGVGLNTLFYHFFLMILRGTHSGLGTTFRVLAYAYSPAIFAIFPGIGAAVGGVWALVISIIGLRVAHRTDLWRVICAVFAPFIIGVGIGLTVFFIAIALGVASAL